MSTEKPSFASVLKQAMCKEHRSDKEFVPAECPCYEAGLERKGCCTCPTAPTDIDTPDCLCFINGLIRSHEKEFHPKRGEKDEKTGTQA